jgi:signal transduction histidine kinase
VLTAVGFCAAALVLLLVGGVSYHSAQMSQARALSMAHTQEVLHGIQELLTLITDAETAQRGFVLTGQEEYLAPYAGARRLYPASLRNLRALISDNPAQLERLDRFQRAADQKLALLGLGPDMRQNAEMLRASIERGDGKRLMDQIRAEAGEMMGVERELLARRAAETSDSADFTRAVIVSGFALAIGLILLSYLLLRQESEERARAQAQVRELNARLKREAGRLEVINRELEGFSYSVSHDLRIPLRAVAGYAQMLEEDFSQVLGAEGMRMLGMVRGSAAAMNALIEDLLAFSRLGSKPLQTAEIDMNQLVGGVVEECTGRGTAELAALTGTPLQADAVPEVLVLNLPAATGDFALLRQVWVNLLSNAVKYSATRRPPQIEIGCRTQGGEQVYYVRDNGVGFDMRYAGKLFGVFQRLHAADEYPGTGVGLAIVQRIIARHGGRVWAQAAPEEGATFSFSLPAHPPAEGEHHEDNHGPD